LVDCYFLSLNEPSAHAAFRQDEAYGKSRAWQGEFNRRLAMTIPGQKTFHRHHEIFNPSQQVISFGDRQSKILL